MTTEMTEAIRSLLLKLRKGATAAFETKQWQAVLVELGFEVIVTKVRNTVVQFQVKLHGVKLAEINKEPRYRRITFYDLISQLGEAKIDPRVMASAKLGLDTPEVEAKLKELYVRDLTNTGTCPVCEGNFKRDANGGMVHHGFIRPGDGMIHGDCFCVGYQPWEVSALGAVEYVAKALRPSLKGNQSYLDLLKAGKITKFQDEKHRWVGYRQEKYTVEVTKESDEYRFGQLLAEAIRQTEKAIGWLTSDIERFEARIAAWKPDVLPEVKYAGKFKAP